MSQQATDATTREEPENTPAVIAPQARRRRTPTRQTKRQHLIRLLSSKTGADVAAISGKLGWQQHTTRAALTHLRKAGYAIAAEKPTDGKATRYRITGTPEKA